MTGTDVDLYALRDAEADAEGRLEIAQATLAPLEQDVTEGRKLAGDTTVVKARHAVAHAKRELARAQRNLMQAEDAAEPEPDEEAASTGAARTLCYDSAEQWVEGFLLPLWRRPTVKWCRQWWKHLEAVTRIEALWRSWEHFRWEGPTGMAVWLRDYLDPAMHVLTDRAGTFAQCEWTSNRHQLQPKLDVDAEPDRMRLGLAAPPQPAPERAA